MWAIDGLANSVSRTPGLNLQAPSITQSHSYVLTTYNPTISTYVYAGTFAAKALLSQQRCLLISVANKLTKSFPPNLAANS
jgi:hypothetical protein